MAGTRIGTEHPFDSKTAGSTLFPGLSPWGFPFPPSREKPWERGWDWVGLCLSRLVRSECADMNWSFGFVPRFHFKSFRIFQQLLQLLLNKDLQHKYKYDESVMNNVVTSYFVLHKHDSPNTLVNSFIKSFWLTVRIYPLKVLPTTCFRCFSWFVHFCHWSRQRYCSK